MSKTKALDESRVPYRINVTLSREESESLSHEAKRYSTTMTEIVRDALALRRALLRETADGNSVYAGKGGEVKKEIVLSVLLGGKP